MTQAVLKHCFYWLFRRRLFYANGLNNLRLFRIYTLCGVIFSFIFQDSKKVRRRRCGLFLFSTDSSVWKTRIFVFTAYILFIFISSSIFQVSLNTKASNASTSNVWTRKDASEFFESTRVRMNSIMCLCDLLAILKRFKLNLLLFLPFSPLRSFIFS